MKITTKGEMAMKLKYISRIATVIIAGLLLIIAGSKIPKE
jgi:hypothetical protein